MKKNILIVEDQWLIADKIKYLLIEEGYEIIGIAKSGEQAVAMAKEQRPDLVMMDIELKDSMNGIEAAIKIGQMYDNLVPIIYLTDQTNPLIINYATKDNNKVTEYFPKPVDKVRLPIKTNFMIQKAKNEHIKWQEAIAKEKQRQEEEEKKQQEELDKERKRFSDALEKIKKERINNLENQSLRNLFPAKTKEDNTKFVNVKDVLFMETDRRGAGTLVIATDGEYTLDKSLTKFLESFPHKNLLRVHNSYIVNIEQTDIINKKDQQVILKNFQIIKRSTHKYMRFFMKNKELDTWNGILPIGRKYRKDVFSNI